MNAPKPEQPTVEVADLDHGTWYQAACSGLWYRNPLAAGSFNAIRINGRLLRVVGAAAVELRPASSADRSAFDSSDLLGEFETALTILEGLRKRPASHWGDRTNYEFLADVMLDLSDIIDSERRHSPNEKLSDCE